MHRREFAQLALLLLISPAGGVLAGCAPELAPDGDAPPRPSSPGTTPAAAVGTLEAGAARRTFGADGRVYEIAARRRLVVASDASGAELARFEGFGYASAVVVDAARERVTVLDVERGQVHTFA